MSFYLLFLLLFYRDKQVVQTANRVMLPCLNQKTVQVLVLYTSVHCIVLLKGLELCHQQVIPQTM